MTIGVLQELGLLTDSSGLRPTIAGWIWDQNNVGVTPLVSEDTLHWLKTQKPRPFFDRARLLLINLAERTNIIGSPVTVIGYHPVDAIVQSFNHHEISAIARFLHERTWITFMPSSGTAIVLGDGFIQAEEWKTEVPHSAQCFVAMWFDPTLGSAWSEGFEPAIASAGFRSRRIDLKQHNNKICDEIIVEIRRSRFVVADFTGHRGGVYYEAGFAAGLGLPVVYTCRKDDLKNLHFDVRQFNCIDWETPAELANRLEMRIEATIGDGPARVPA